MKSATELVCVSKQQRCFVSEGIYSFERLGESVINNPFLTLAFCFLTEWMNEWCDASLIKTLIYRHLLAILVLNLQVGYHFVLPPFIALFIVLIIAYTYWNGKNMT